MKTSKKHFLFFATLISFLFLINVAAAQEIQRVNKFVFDTVPLDLQELTDTADRIFTGVCTNVEKVDKDPIAKLSIVKYTFKIVDKIKGLEGKSTVTFKQWGVLSSDSNYLIGKKYILFLYPNSEKGLTSPVGYLQGQFDIRKDKSNNEIVKNKSGNIGLTRSIVTRKRIVFRQDSELNDYIDKCSQESDFIRYKDFVKAVKYLIGNK